MDTQTGTPTKLWLWLSIILLFGDLSEAIDFGYHPSAEEFDSLLRETTKQSSWSRDLLQQQQQHHHQRFVHDNRGFVPRYQHQTSIRFQPPELDFQLFDQDQDQPSQPYVFESVEEDASSVGDQLHVQSELLEIKEPNRRPSPGNSSYSSTSTSFPIYFTHPSTGIVYAISQVGAGGAGGLEGSGVIAGQSRNDSNAIAIYVTKAQYDADMEKLRRRYEQQCQQPFAPPGTVISTLNPSQNQHHQQQQMGGITTARPQIIRLKKPKYPPARPSNKLPKPSHRPPPVMVTSGPIDHVSDQLLKLPHRGGTTIATSTSTSTTRRPSTLRKRRKKKKTTKDKVAKRRPRPGYGGNNTRNQPGPLPIILGKRPSGSSTTTKPPLPAYTQLEKPHMPVATTQPTGNVFSQHFYRAGEEPGEDSEKLEESGEEGSKEGSKEAGTGENSSRRRRSLEDLHEGKEGPTKNQEDKEDLRRKEKNLVNSTKINGETKRLHSLKNLKTWRKALKSSLRREENSPKPFQARTHRRQRRALQENTPETGIQDPKKSLGPPRVVSARRVSTPPRSTPRRRSKGSSSKPKTKQPPQTPAPKDKGKADVAHMLPTAIHLAHWNHTRKEHETQKTPSNPTSLRKNQTERIIPPKLKKKTKSKERKRGRPEGSSFPDLFELMADDDDDYDEDGKEDQDEDDEDYFYGSFGGNQAKRRHTGQQSDQKEDSSSAEEGADFGAMEEEVTTPTATTSSEEEAESEATSSTKNSMPKKKIRIRRRPVDTEEDYDDDDEDSGIGGFFRMLFYPVQVAMSRLMDGFGSPEEDEQPPGPTISKYPSYTLYHNAHSNEAYAEPEEQEEAEEEEESSSLGSWFSSWFGLQRRTKKIGSTTTTTVVPLPTPAKEPPGWLESWFGFGKTTATPEAEEEEEDDYDKWFASWFDSRPKRKVRRRSTTSTSTTSTTTTSPAAAAGAAQVPILTIVDPLRNPQNWIGILAHHIVNSTATTTSNPLLQALATRMTSTRGTTSTSTSTTTSRPEVPRRINYDKYQIWRLKPQDETQVRALEDFKKGEDGVKMQWLKGPSLRGLTDVLVPPKMLVDFQGTLNYEGIAHEVLIFDVGKAIAYERSKEDYLHTTRPSKQQPLRATIPPPMTWNRYHNHDEIVKYLETVRMRHPQLVELIHIGRSYEGRPLIVVKIESKQGSSSLVGNSDGGQPVAAKRPKRKHKAGQANAVFVEAGAQGLAWIGPATATWMIAELLRLMKTNKSTDEVEFIRNTTWYVMPVLNPDGYAYSHEYDRFWKKSRSQHQAPAPSGLLDSAMTWLQQKRGTDKVCYGVDLDRNWLYQWGKRGSSKAPCNEFFAGPTPFSEPETKAVSEFLMDYRTQIKLYISLQAYGQVISYPVKANSTFNSERLDDFLDVAMVGTDGLRKKGSKSRYKVDASNDLIEQRSGCADAFAAYEIGIPFSYTLQLADNGVHGYLLPSSAIEPTARDAFEIISGMMDYI
ncbi:uncharacterized protein [Drosophila kikkawai]|uniref:Peptidase M14 domain-containing protein n=1 Tax=Drosophila kikkawai TaxID=30033 RepID=A0A6P4IPE9_DROKI|nr:uncharacterized protein LOC108080220 [Drosophila kikkawai]